ncbi:MAG: response regulator [Proteobacteria bacterium]|nr:response regulator [Pseudomonadota bacterium]
MKEQTKKIHIIDDDVSVIEILSDYLKLSDFEVSYNQNPVEALNDLSSINPDVILLDLNMPEMNGFDVLKKIRNNVLFNNTGVILLTSHDHINYKIKGLEEGADDYITKPFQKAEVLARVRAVLRRYEKNTGAKEIKEDDLLKGDLARFTLVDLLQFFDINKKKGKVRLLDIDGEIDIANGSFADIRYKNFLGLDALRRILLFNYGKFEVDFDFAVKDVKGFRISDVLLDCLSYIDELKRDIQPEFEENSVIIIMDKSLSSKFNLTKEEVNILELLSLYPLDLKEGIWILKNLFENKRIKIKGEEK